MAEALAKNKVAQDTWSAFLQQQLNPQACSHLQREGWLVSDGAPLDFTLCQALRAEIQALKQAKGMHLNSTHLVRGAKRTLLEKAHIWEADLPSPATQKAAPQHAAIWGDSTLRTLLSIFLPQLRLEGQTMKLQANAGNRGCFPIHADSDESVDARRLTAILYLSDPGWQPDWGGQLRLYPVTGPAVDIMPSEGRLVLFSTCRMLHRVLPSHRERFCFTIWASQARPEKQQLPVPAGVLLKRMAAMPDLSLDDRARAIVLQPELRKLAQKLLLQEEWRQSIEESHPPGEGREAALEQLQHDSQLMRSALQTVVDVSQLARIVEQGAELCRQDARGMAPTWF